MLKDQIATFEYVSVAQYINARHEINNSCIDDDELIREYKSIKIPSRATRGSVGFDFYLPFDIELDYAESIVIPTGIRCKIDEGFSLDIYPKSGLGFKHFTTIANTVGIIDSDYYYSDNEGHIIVKLINKGFNVSNGGRTLIRKQGESFVQGILHECFGATNDLDNREMKIRNGGFDSTNK